MSINACNINEFTINSLCGSRRSIIIDLLTDQRPHQQHVNPTTQQPLRIFRRELDHAEEAQHAEQPVMSVTVNIGGEVHSQAINRDDFTPLISVSKIKLRELSTADISVMNFTTRIIPE